MTLLRGTTRLIALAAAALLVSGCVAPVPDGAKVVGVPIRVQQPAQPNSGCPAALASGVLVAHPEHGLALRTEPGRAVAVLWPFGYSAVRVGGGPVVLLDPLGRAVAREGDQVQMGGGFVGDDGAFLTCESPTVIAPAP